mmetsp:Transcript_35229/g.92822  ORF Transcript_35229/g.92822 Transcript_35229/m.92822 type:complete len:1830 (+) Transcript_35229:94-5583(+)
MSGEAQARVLDTFRGSLKGSGVLTVHQIRQLLKALGRDCSEDQVAELVGSVEGTHGKGHIRYEDFVRWIFSAVDQAPPGAAQRPQTAPPPTCSSPWSPQSAIPKEGAVGEAGTEASRTPVAAAAVRSDATAAAAESTLAAGTEKEVIVPPVAPKPVADTAGVAHDARRPPRPTSAGTAIANASFSLLLEKILKEHPYLEPGCSTFPHPLQYWVTRCREASKAKKFEQAEEHYRRIVTGLTSDLRQIREAFRRFDADASNHLDASECRHLCAYLGWGEEEACLLDVDQDGRVTFEDFQAFVGNLGGVQQLFEQRRLRISTSRRDVCDYAGIAVGARVRAHYYVRGHKSKHWKEAQVLAVGMHQHYGQTAGLGPPTLGVLLEFGFGNAGWRARQVVPPSWVLSSVEDAHVAAALRESGILDEQQSFWALLLPDSEMQAIERLEGCQRKALALVRAQASENHDKALPDLRARFEKLGFGPRELSLVFSWIQDLAPVVIHVHLDRMGAFLEVDEFYRNQFETKTSCGALDPENNTRKGWERELFAGAYEDAKPFERCKYGALNVMNDYRGVVSAKQYGDSYLVLKDVRLRCTFASTDSGGISGSRLAVLDKYAHVLAEYKDQEIRGLVAVAEAAANPDAHKGDLAPQLIRGPTEDPTMDWVTVGFPQLAQTTGRYYFEVELLRECSTPQVGLLSMDFERLIGVASTTGVGDNEHGWAVDGQNATRWHAGPKPWGQIWSSEPLAGNSRYNPQGPVPALTQAVVVGIAVDLNERKIWFASDGHWDSDPTFGPDEFLAGLALYPAVSLRGRAAFHFGPSLQHPPSAELGVFGPWPGAAEGALRVDVPHIGNSETLSIYKEVQVHGEVSLKRHVQRLVASRKYLDMPKTQRSWAIQVKGSGKCDGTYRRAGAHCDFPLYRNSTAGSSATIFFDSEAMVWRMSTTSDLSNAFCFAPAQEGCAEPPRRGWRLPDDEQGVMSAGIIRAALAGLKIQSEIVQQVLAPLTNCSATGDNEEVVYRVHGEATLEEQWKMLGDGVSATADETWDSAISEVQKRMLKEAGLPDEAMVVETRHPYEATRHTWRKEVRCEGAAGLAVYFCSRSCTLDCRARLRIYIGGLRRGEAGVGARVEVSATRDGGKVWGTVVDRDHNGGIWRVLLDRRAPPEPAEATKEASEADWPHLGDEVSALFASGAGNWYDAVIAEVKGDGTFLVDWSDGDSRDRTKTREQIRRRGASEVGAQRVLEDMERYASVPSSDADCFCVCMEDPKPVNVLYSKSKGVIDEQGYVSSTVGDEIASFVLDRSCPLSPFAIGCFSGRGPAQEQGVATGWFLDLVATVHGPSGGKVKEVLKGIGGSDSTATKAIIDAAFNNIEETHSRLNGTFRTLSEITLVFTTSSSPSNVSLLPEARAVYGASSKVGDEIRALGFAEGKILVQGFTTKGPAHQAGVRSGWALDVGRTLALNKTLTDFPAAEAIQSEPSVMLKLIGVTLAFFQPDPTPKLRFLGMGTAGLSRWGSFALPGDAAEFEFSTDGDGTSTNTEQRWGIWALVLPLSVPAASSGDASGCTDEVTVIVEKAEGMTLGTNLDSSNRSSLFIKTMTAGLLEDWNKENPDKMVRVCDFIVQVGCIRDDVDKMLQLLGGSGTITLVVKRSPKPTCAKGHELRRMPGSFCCGICNQYTCEAAGCTECCFPLCVPCFSRPRESLPPVLPDLDAFERRYTETTQRAKGNRERPEVERESWDEQRLRALCARHGWDFEWMTEEGERRRRARERQGTWTLPRSPTSPTALAAAAAALTELAPAPAVAADHPDGAVPTPRETPRGEDLPPTAAGASAIAPLPV